MNSYKRFPPDILSYAVWLYYPFSLSHRDIGGESELWSVIYLTSLA